MKNLFDKHLVITIFCMSTDLSVGLSTVEFDYYHSV